MELQIDDRLLDEAIERVLSKKHPKNNNKENAVPERVLLAAAQQRYFNLKESANFLGVSSPTFKKWSQKYHIAPVIIDSTVCWDKKDLEEFMNQRKVRL